MPRENSVIVRTYFELVSPKENALRMATPGVGDGAGEDTGE